MWWSNNMSLVEKACRYKVYIWSSGGLLLLPDKVLRTSWLRRLKEALMTSPRRHPSENLRKGCRDFHFRSVWDVLRRSKLRRFYNVFVTSLCRSRYWLWVFGAECFWIGADFLHELDCKKDIQFLKLAWLILNFELKAHVLSSLKENRIGRKTSIVKWF